MDKFNSQNKTQFILDDHIFEEFSSVMVKHASEILRSKGISEKICSALCNTLQGINRRSYVDKAKTLIGYLGVSYNDTGITLHDIKNVRNDIIYRGKYHKEGEAGLTKVTRTYRGLGTILTRILLAILSYDKYYKDPFMEGKWIEFSSVCTVPRHQDLAGRSTEKDKSKLISIMWLTMHLVNYY